ncbi:hypothetical protein NIES4103_21570 [Nostoc sp. NIES-4103]|nr:hypothetical protein NIES4103_21570 [Nostoc sp. NIES-4103]
MNNTEERTVIDTKLQFEVVRFFPPAPLLPCSPAPLLLKLLSLNATWFDCSGFSGIAIAELDSSQAYEVAYINCVHL